MIGHVLMLLLNLPSSPGVERDTVSVPVEGVIGVVDGDDRYQFGWVTDIAVDTDGFLFVVDNEFSRVQVYDTTGTYVRTIGRRGPGPREFLFPRQVAIGSDSLVIVSDEGKGVFSVLTRDGDELLTTVPLSGGGHYFDGIFVGEEGGWIYDGRQGWGEFADHSFVVAAPVFDSSPPDTIPIPRPERAPIMVSGPTGYSAPIQQPLSVRTLWTVLPNGTVAATSGVECEIVLLDRHAPPEAPTRKLRCGILRHGAPRSARREAVERARSEIREHAEIAGSQPADFEDEIVEPSHYPRFLGMTSDPDGGLWVAAPDSVVGGLLVIRLAGTGPRPPVARLLHTSGLRPETMAVGGGWLYMQAKGDLGIDQIYRYRLPVNGG